MEPDEEMLSNLEMLMEMDVLEEESSWELLQEADLDELDKLEENDESA